MHKIFAFNNGGPHGWMHAVAIADDGHVIGQHICSSEGFMPHDLGINSNWKHDGYDKHFGAGNWQIEWVPTDQIKTHAELQAAFELNKALPPPPESEMPGAVITTVDAEGNEHTHRVGP